MNLAQKAITILGIATFASGLLSVVYVQALEIVQKEPLPSSEQTTDPEINSQSNNQLDLDLLVQSITNFFQEEFYETESQIEFNATSQGVTIVFNVQVKTVVKSPNQFYSEIVFSQGKEGRKRYILVSNGEQIWTYSPELKQYAISYYEDFDRYEDGFLMGVSSLFFLEFSEEVRMAIAENLLSEQNVLETIGMSNDSPSRGGFTYFEGKEYYVYDYTDQQEGFTTSFFIEPNSATLKQIQLAGKEEDLEIVFKEEIVRRVANPLLANDIFSFSPPTGFTMVEKLPIQPF